MTALTVWRFDSPHGAQTRSICSSDSARKTCFSSMMRPSSRGRKTGRSRRPSNCAP